MDLIKDGKILLIETFPKIVKGIMIIIIAYIFAKFVKMTISNINFNKDNTSHYNQKLVMSTFSTIIFWIIFLYGVIIALKCFGVDLSSLLVIVGSVGLAIALSLQSTITEIAAGMMILGLNYYDIGDLVSIENGSDKIFGKIYNFDLFTTTIKDSDRLNHRIPNTNIVKSHLINYYKENEINVGFELSMSNNNEVDINNLIESLKQTIIIDVKEFIINVELIEILVIDMSASGTKLYVRIPVESKNYIPARNTSKKVIREFCAKNSLRLLDNHYTTIKGDYYS